MTKPDDLTDIMESHTKIENLFMELRKLVREAKEINKPDIYIVGSDHPLFPVLEKIAEEEENTKETRKARNRY